MTRLDLPSSPEWDSEMAVVYPGVPWCNEEGMRLTLDPPPPPPPPATPPPLTRLHLDLPAAVQAISPVPLPPTSHAPQPSPVKSLHEYFRSMARACPAVPCEADLLQHGEERYSSTPHLHLADLKQSASIRACIICIIIYVLYININIITMSGCVHMD
ncbi:unnamed protein product [Arctogadus glacialis]